MATQLPRGMASLQAQMRAAQGDPSFDLLAEIMRRYNDDGATLDELKA